MPVTKIEDGEMLSTSNELEKMKRELEAPEQLDPAEQIPAKPASRLNVLAPWTRVTSIHDAKALACATLSPTDAFLLSRLPPEGMTVEEIVDVTRLGTVIVSEALGRLSAAGLVTLA